MVFSREMAEGNTAAGRRAACEYCGEATAVLFCRADSARLCVACDRHVHAANALSRKHVRSPICDNCGAMPANARYAADGLALCSDCDWDSHGGGDGGDGSQHARVSIEGFSGCPTAMELAASWGFDLVAKEPSPPPPPPLLTPMTDELLSNWSHLDPLLGVDLMFQDHYVPCAPEIHRLAVKRQKNPHRKQPLFLQLMELAKTELETSPACDLRPSTPCRTAGGCHEELGEPQPMPYTSLLMLAPAELEGSDRLVEEDDLRWGCRPPDQPAQV